MSKRGRVATIAALAGAVAVGLAVVPTASETATNDGLSASVVPTTRAPLPACTLPNCTVENTVWQFVHVSNTNRFEPAPGTFRNRTTIVNAFVVTSVDAEVLVDGAHYTDFTIYPPPNATDVLSRNWAGHWPATVTCPATGECNVVTNPAIVPGEDTAAVYTGWIHAVGEPNGVYVFRYTVHGTLNGDPVDLSASSPPIVMTD
jgi:hypothetical protein